MKVNPSRIFNRGFGLIEIILVAAVICFIAFLGLKAYVHNPVVDEPTQKILSEQGIDASSQKAVLDSTRDKISEINKCIHLILEIFTIPTV